MEDGYENEEKAKKRVGIFFDRRVAGRYAALVRFAAGSGIQYHPEKIR